MKINCIYMLIWALIFSANAEIQKRKSFSVPLAFITTSLNTDGTIDEVFVTFKESHEGWVIAPGNDRYVKDSRKFRMDHTYIESESQNWQLSTFEASLIDKVCTTFLETLKIFEKDLQNQKWDRCRYLDYWIPIFIRNFYFLLSAARNSDHMLPKVICISDSLFDKHSDSPKSDERIRKWQGNAEHILKLRITTKELIHQIEQWQAIELRKPDRDIFGDHSGKFIKDLELFTRLYFNLPPPETVKKGG